MNFSKIIQLAVLCLFSISLNAQDPDNNSSEFGFQRSSALNKSLVAPNSPEASSLGKFGEFNVSAYTGSASLQVPILTIAGKTTSIPINLVYDGTAIKVDQREGWTGVSWNLTANFAITRNVAANPDMDVNYYSKKDSLNPQTHTDLFRENKLLYDIAKGCIESQPDNFYLSGPFGSAKFYISPDKEIYQKEHQNLTINAFYELDGDISRFTVRDDKGLVYEYNAVEETNFFVDDQFSGDLAPCPPLNYRYNSAWHLTKILGTNGVEQFLFEYETATNQYALDINPDYYESVTYNPQNLSSPNCCGNPNESSTATGVTNTSHIIGRKHLLNIKYVLGTDTLERVLFESTASPCPYANNTDKKLNRIRCLKGDNGEVNIKDYELKYYTGGGDDCSTIDRLLLRSVQEKSADGSESKPPYTFAYDTTATLPNYISTEIDHFGYWNLNPQSTLIPKITPQGGTVLNSTGANRNPDFNRTHVGILEQVSFPTGGYSKYIWEMHKVKGLGAGNYYDYAPTQDPALDREVGGLRIKTIENYDCDNTLLTKRSWKYEKSGTNPVNESSSGIMLNEIRYTSTLTFDYCPVLLWGGGGNCNTDFICERTNISATSKSTLGTIKGSHVGYSRIEEIIESNDGSGETSGKTVYLFKNEKLSQFGLKDDVENGLLTKKEIYDADDKILDKAVYTYSTDEGEMRRRTAFFGFRVVAKDVQDNKIFLCTNANGQFFWTEESGNQDCVEQMLVNTKFERRFTEHLQRWVYQSEMTNTRYFYHSSGTLTGKVTTTTDYVYGDTTTNQPTETIILNSDGKEYKTTTHFINSYDPSEYPIVNTDMFVRSMQLKGMTSFPVVQAQYIDGALVYKTKLDYHNTSSNLTLPHKLYEQFPNTGDLLAEVFDDYDGVGNLRQGHRHYEHSSGESQPVSMIYSNENSRMAAQVKNAELDEIAYTGFESHDTYQGGWTVPDISNNVLFDGTVIVGGGNFRTNDFSGATISTLIGEGTYIVSYYTTDVNGINVSGTGVSILATKSSTDHPLNWKYVEREIEVVTGGGKTPLNVEVEHWDGLDELRLYPADALMTTFNYDKDSRLVVGIQDENSLSNHFEYDKLLRLTGVRNFDDHYISLNEYLYQNNCNNGNAVRSWTVLAEGQTDANTAKNLGSGDVVKVFSYFDGIGRNLMSASVGTSAAQKDQIQFYQYDEFGRQVQQFLPYTATSNGGAFRSNALTEQQTFIGAEYGSGNSGFGLIETELESSPLNRIFQQTAPGSTFNSYPTETEYGAVGPNQVRNFHVMNAWYGEDELFKITQRDENGNGVFTYTDKLGRKIMQDQQGSKTYFLYDDNGLLEQVIQPEAAQKGHDTPMLYHLSSQIIDGSFLYTYDNEHRMKTKVVPNCAAYTYHYDDLDQLVMTEDGNGFKTFTKYDKLGRPIVTGRYKGSATPSTSQVVFEERSPTAPHYYTTNQSFPDDGNIDVYTVTYYDDYDIDGDNTEEITYETATGYDSNDYDFVRGIPTASKVAILNNDGSTPTTYLNAYTFYDQFRRVIHSRKDNHLSGQDKVWSDYNFPGWLLKTRREHSTDIVGNLTNKTINERWEYDHIGRELQYFHEVEGDQSEKLISEKAYNERDELITKKIGETTSNNFLQTVDYQYNIRRWLTAINDPQNLGNDLFGMSINYTGIQNVGDTPNYNGNIGSITWKNSSDEIEKKYAYYYDNLNRLTAANYSQIVPDVGSINSSNFTTSSDQYNTAYTYDRNGNIETLTRNGLTGGIFAQIDNLDYDYADDGALNSIAETSEKEHGFKSKTAGGTGGYTYDDNGNMLTDAHKGITVSYNFLNLPTKVTKGSESIEWTYDAAGIKLTKKVISESALGNHIDVPNPILNQEYLAGTIESDGDISSSGDVIFTAEENITLTDGFSVGAGGEFWARIMPNLGGLVMTTRDYCGGLEYLDSELEAIYFVEGRVKYDGVGSEREFYLSDYQGNARILFRDTGGTVEVVEEYAGYYPFGAIHSQANDYQNKYLNEGKELQTELNLEWSDYHLRCKDNWMGRFTGIDVLADAYANTSPYSYGLGNPVSNGDPTGASVQTFTGEEAQQVFEGVKNSYNTDVIRGKDVTIDADKIGGFAGGFMKSGSGNNDNGNQGGDNNGGGDPPNDGVGVSYHHYEQAKKDDWNWESTSYGLAISGGLLADDATGIGVLDDVAIPVIIVGAAAMTLYDNRELINEWADDISRTVARRYGNGRGFQYTLRAIVDGYYPIMAWGSRVPVGTTFLRSGEIWKIGETSKSDRYNASYLNGVGPGVRMVPEFFGTIPQIKLMEKAKIWGYVFRNFSLPPGNKMFR